MLKWVIIGVVLAYSVIGYASPNSVENDDFARGLAALVGNADAQGNLGNMYNRGRGVG